MDKNINDTYENVISNFEKHLNEFVNMCKSITNDEEYYKSEHIREFHDYIAETALSLAVDSHSIYSEDPDKRRRIILSVAEDYYNFLTGNTKFFKG